jgi:hypothetical protein
MKSLPLLVLATSVATPSVHGLALPQPLIQGAQLYVRALTHFPTQTNVITASALCVVSDAISQAAERRNAALASTPANGSPVPQPHSYYRSLCMSVYGALVYGFVCMYWLRWLNTVVPQSSITPLLVVKKVIINQAVMSPFLNSCFFTWVSFTRDLSLTLGQRAEATRKKLAQDLVPTIVRSCMYWGVAQSVNFWYVSRLLGVQWQLLYVNLSFVLWTSYLALVGYRPTETAATATSKKL